MSEESVQKVAVTDIHMGFGSMVTFMVKWAFATIPAIVLIWLIAVVFVWLFGVVTGTPPGTLL